MSVEANKQVVRTIADAHVRHDVARVREILSPKLVWHMSGKQFGRDDYLNGLEEGARAFSDLGVELEQVIGEGDLVASLWKIHMRHTGPFQGLSPTNRDVDFTSAWMYRIVDNKVVEAWLVDEDFVSKLR
jgi:predicted ester cyclase